MRKPTYNVYVTQETQPDENGEKNTYWTKVGAAFAHNGKLVLLEPKDDAAPQAAPVS